jgi:hypothetical protein
MTITTSVVTDTRRTGASITRIHKAIRATVVGNAIAVIALLARIQMAVAASSFTDARGTRAGIARIHHAIRATIMGRGISIVALLTRI